MSKPENIELCAKLFQSLSDFEQDVKPAYNKEAYAKVLRRVIVAIINKEKMKIVGDKDADGIYSGRSLWKHIQMVYDTIHKDTDEGKARDRVSYFDTTRESGFGMLEKDFHKFQKEGNTLVICTDQGTSLPYINDDTEGLLILDHHPSEENAESLKEERKILPWFIISPNINRQDNKEYSTSAGAVVKLFIDNLELNLESTVKEYRRAKEIEVARKESGEISESIFTIKKNIFRSLCALTLISDMAIMDKKNRAEVNRAMNFFSENPNILPMLSEFEGDFTQRKASFANISLVNVLNRMDGKMEVATDFITPSSMEDYNTAKDYLEELNKTKKGLVKKHFEIFNRNKDDKDNSPLHFYFDEKMPVGLGGLIANKISSMNGKEPTFVFTIKKDGTISASARGKNCKKLVLGFIDSSDFIGGGGGHDDAMGFSIKPKEKQTNAEAISEFIIEFKKGYDTKLVEEKEKYEVPIVDGVTLEEFLNIHQLYRDYAGGAEFYKRIHVVVSDFELAGITEHKSPWASVHLRDLKNKDIKTEKTVLVDLSILSQEILENKDGNSALLIELTGNGDISIIDSGKKEEILKKVVLAKELVSEQKEIVEESIAEEVEESTEPKAEPTEPKAEEKTETETKEEITETKKKPEPKEKPKKKPTKTTTPQQGLFG